MLQKLIGKTWFLCLLISASLSSQSLYLKAEGTVEYETKIIDSLKYKKKFENYATLKSEIENLKQRVETLGFLESEITHIIKENDSLYLVKFHLKNKYHYIHIYYNIIYIL